MKKKTGRAVKSRPKPQFKADKASTFGAGEDYFHQFLNRTMLLLCRRRFDGVGIRAI